MRHPLKNHLGVRELDFWVGCGSAWHLGISLTKTSIQRSRQCSTLIGFEFRHRRRLQGNVLDPRAQSPLAQGSKCPLELALRRLAPRSPSRPSESRPATASRTAHRCRATSPGTTRARVHRRRDFRDCGRRNPPPAGETAGRRNTPPAGRLYPRGRRQRVGLASGNSLEPHRRRPPDPVPLPHALRCRSLGRDSKPPAQVKCQRTPKHEFARTHAAHRDSRQIASNSINPDNRNVGNNRQLGPRCPLNHLDLRTHLHPRRQTNRCRFDGYINRALGRMPGRVTLQRGATAWRFVRLVAHHNSFGREPN
jgi:hypothetical protein